MKYKLINCIVQSYMCCFFVLQGDSLCVGGKYNVYFTALVFNIVQTSVAF